MSQDFGSQAPREHQQTTHRAPVRYLVIIEAGGPVVARLFLANREQAGEFDAGTEEVPRMIGGLLPVQGAEGPEWDRALEGHSAAERRSARVYTLEI
jgi:hypothetical protein